MSANVIKNNAINFFKKKTNDSIVIIKGVKRSAH